MRLEPETDRRGRDGVDALVARFREHVFRKIVAFERRDAIGDLGAEKAGAAAEIDGARERGVALWLRIKAASFFGTE